MRRHGYREGKIGPLAREPKNDTDFIQALPYTAVKFVSGGTAREDSTDCLPIGGGDHVFPGYEDPDPNHGTLDIGKLVDAGAQSLKVPKRRRCTACVNERG